MEERGTGPRAITGSGHPLLNANPLGTNSMTDMPPAEFHAEEIDVHLTIDGTMAMLTLVNQTQGLSVTLPRPAQIYCVPKAQATSLFEIGTAEGRTITRREACRDF
jgi:hypothetical protein